MRLQSLLVFTVVLGALSGKSTAQASLDGAEYYRLNEQAKDALDAGKLVDAAALYERLLFAHSGNGDLWEKLAGCYERLSQFPKAAMAYEHALDLAAGNRAYIENQIAEMWGHAGDRDKALEWLRKAVTDGNERRAGVLADSAFAGWKDDPAFIAAAGQNKPPNLTRDQQWQFDVDFLLSEIRRLHYRYRSDPLPPAITESAKAIRSQVHDLSDDQIVVRIQRILAQLGDGHDLVYFFFGEHALKRLPVNLYQFSDGLYVIRAQAGHRDLIGNRVLKIGDLDSETIAQKLAPYVSRDNEVQNRAMGVYFMTTAAFLGEIGAVKDVDHIGLTLRTPSGEIKTAVVDPVSDGALIKSLVSPDSPIPAPLYLTRLNEPFWFTELPEAHAVYLQFHQVMNARAETLEAFSARLKHFLDEKHPDNLIVDVRHNTGGDEGLLPPLLRTIIQFEASKPNAQIYVISGRATFSACEIFLAQVERLTHAVFAGEPSASSANFIGEDIPVPLPFSGLTVSISTRYHQGNPGDPWVWIAPAIPVSLSSGDYFANKDPVLQAVVGVIGGK